MKNSTVSNEKTMYCNYQSKSVLLILETNSSNDA